LGDGAYKVVAEYAFDKDMNRRFIKRITIDFDPNEGGE
jgi:hypothetical protein